ncbi:hypothetical protein AUK22_08480 [bacterium CG2_30_54_10]|nr:MAG: hypothetical protein AUK22_08480 [bacterium CG2_30_54_10]
MVVDSTDEDLPSRAKRSHPGEPGLLHRRCFLAMANSISHRFATTWRREGVRAPLLLSSDPGRLANEIRKTSDFEVFNSVE